MTNGVSARSGFVAAAVLLLAGCGSSEHTDGGGGPSGTFSASSGLGVTISVDWSGAADAAASATTFAAVVKTYDLATNGPVDGALRIGNETSQLAKDAARSTPGQHVATGLLASTGKLVVDFQSGGRSASGTLVDPMPWVGTLVVPATAKVGAPLELTWTATPNASCIATVAGANNHSSASAPDTGRLTVPGASLTKPGSCTVAVRCGVAVPGASRGFLVTSTATRTASFMAAP